LCVSPPSRPGDGVGRGKWLVKTSRRRFGLKQVEDGQSDWRLRSFSRPTLNERMRSWGAGGARVTGCPARIRSEPCSDRCHGDHDHCKARCVINPTHEENVTNVAPCLELPQNQKPRKSKSDLFRVVRRSRAMLSCLHYHPS